MLTFERLKEILNGYEHEEWGDDITPYYTCHQFTISQYPNSGVVVDVDYDEKSKEIANLEIYSTNYNFRIYVDYKEDVFLQLLKIACPEFEIKKEEK